MKGLWQQHRSSTRAESLAIHFRNISEENQFQGTHRCKRLDIKTSPRKLIKMQNLRFRSHLLNQKLRTVPKILCFDKHLRQFEHTLRFESYYCMQRQTRVHFFLPPQVRSNHSRFQKGEESEIVRLQSPQMLLVRCSADSIYIRSSVLISGLAGVPLFLIYVNKVFYKSIPSCKLQ